MNANAPKQRGSTFLIKMKDGREDIVINSEGFTVTTNGALVFYNILGVNQQGQQIQQVRLVVASDIYETCRMTTVQAADSGF